MSLIKGIPIILYNQVNTGLRDGFGAPLFEEEPEQVENVLVSPSSYEDVTKDFQLYGVHAAYDLCIPKGDEHEWENRKVSFFGQTFRTYGPVVQYIEANVPLQWNKKVRVERYG